MFIPTLGREVSLNEIQALWTPYYANRQTQLGATATLVNFGDQRNAGKVNATTFTGMKFSASGPATAPTWTPGIALSTFATAFDLTNPSTWQGLAPGLVLKGSGSEYLSTPDAAYWTTAAASAFSVGLWYKYAAGGTNVLWAKDDTNLREFLFQLEASGKPAFYVFDQTGGTFVSRTYNTVVVAGVWHQIIATYGGGTTDATCLIYMDGAQVDDTNNGSGVFVTMRDLTAAVQVGATLSAGAASGFANGTIAGGPFCPFFCQAALTAAQVKNLYAFERLGMCL